VSVSVSVLTLSLISVERFYAIVHPLAFRSTTRRVRIMIVIVWITSLGIYAPELYALGLFRRIDPDLSQLLTSCRPVGWDYDVQAAYSLCLTVVLYLLPFCLMGYTYSKIAMCLWRNSIPTESNSSKYLVYIVTTLVLAYYFTLVHVISTSTQMDIANSTYTLVGTKYMSIRVSCIILTPL
jgi:hypothetical protein